MGSYKSKQLLNRQEMLSMQHESNQMKKWYQFRAGRITASKIHAVCHTEPSVPFKSLIKQICYPISYRISSPVSTWGCQHEEIAQEMYFQTMVESYNSFELTDYGFHISLELPITGASPDDLVNCKCC